MNSVSATSTTMSTTPAKRAPKRVAASAASTVVPEPPAAALAPSVSLKTVSPAAPVEVVAPKRRVAKKVVAAAEPVVVEAITQVEQVQPAVEEHPVTESSWNDDLASVTTNLCNMRQTLTELLTQVKRLEKKVVRTVKEAGKGKRKITKRVDENGNEIPKRPGAFKIPQDITDELNAFFGQPSGTQMSRAQVTSALTAYAKSHNLMEGQRINTDANLARILNPSANLKEGENLTIFTLQKCLRNHYVKAAPVAIA